MECGATVHTGGLPDGRRRRTASILAGIAAGLLCGLAQAQEVKTLRWTPPTERVDGSALSADQLAAHRVLCEPGVDVSVQMPATSWAGVEPGIESCVVRAVDQDGLESVDSARVYPEWEPEPQPDPPGAPTDFRAVAVELPPSTGPPGGDVVAFPVGWQRRAPLVIQSSEVSETLTDFPLLLTPANLPSEMFDADGSSPAQNGGGDVRFSSDDAGANQLAAEIVRFSTDNDPANGTAEIWVKVPSISASTDTTIYVWYNTSETESQPAVAEPFGRNAVWSGYEWVLHLNESSGPWVDSTGNGHDATLILGSSISSVTAGHPYGGSWLDFTDTQGLEIAGSAQTLNNSAATIYFWQSPDTAENFDVAVSNRRLAAGDSHWFQCNSNGKWSVKDTAERFIDPVADHRFVTKLMHFVYVPGVEIRQYANGISLASGATTVDEILTPSGNDFRIGNYYNDTYFADSRIGEVRAIRVALSAGWIDAEYSNQSAPAAFVIDGTPETPAGGTTVEAGLATGAEAAAGFNARVVSRADISAATSAGATHGASSTIRAAISEGATAQQVASGVASMAAQLAESTLAGAEATARATLAASITEGAGAGEAVSRQGAVLDQMVAAAEADALLSAYLQAVAALAAGVEAGDAWAARLTAAATFSGAAEASGTFSEDSVALIAAESEAGAQFAAAVHALAEQLEGATAGAAMAGIVSTLAAFSSASSAGAVFESAMRHADALQAGAESGAAFSGITGELTGHLLSAVSAGMVVSSAHQARAAWTSTAHAGASFVASGDVSALIGALAFVVAAEQRVFTVPAETRTFIVS